MAKNLTPAEEKLLREACSTMVMLMHERLLSNVPLLPDSPKDKHEALARLLHCAAEVMKERKIFVSMGAWDELTQILNGAAKTTTRTPGATPRSHYAIILSEENYVRLTRLCNKNGASDEPAH